MKIKSMFVLGLFLVGILALSGIASAVMPVTINWVKLDGDIISDSVTSNEINALDKGDELEVKVKITADQVDVEDIQIEAYLRGYDHDDKIEDITSVFDLDNETSRTKTLTLKFPKRMDQDSYKLRIEVADRDGDTLVKTYALSIETGRHDVAIKDVILSPAGGVKAGRALLATVRVQNYGSGDEDDVKVTFSIPDLGRGLSASDYIDEIEADGDDKDTKSTEELYLRIPQCAEAGEYDAEVKVTYHDGDKTVTEDLIVEVVADDTCVIADGVPSTKAGKSVITVGPESQDITKGAGGVIYPVTISNAGSAKTYVISVTGGDWGTFKVSPSNVVTVGSDETESVYIYAAAKDSAAAGEQVFGVEIKSGDKSVKEVALKANVVGSAGGVNLKKALEVGLIVLVVILVILGLVIGFNKLKGSDEEKEEGESYY